MEKVETLHLKEQESGWHTAVGEPHLVHSCQAFSLVGYAPGKHAGLFSHVH